MGAISNSGKNENGHVSGGKPGDQNGQEWKLCPWYNRPWNCVLRYPNAKVAATMNNLAVAAAKNDHIGYDQPRRTTYWDQLKANNYDPSKITKDCDDDCSAGVCANIKAAGYICGDTRLQDLPITSTHYMRAELTKRGFQCFTSSDYTRSSAKLQPGDVLLNDNAHAAMWTDGTGGATGGAAGGGATGAGGTASLGIGSYQFKDYVVKANDTIFSIAKHFRCTPAMIIFVNDLTSSVVFAGQKLKIPTTNATLEASPTEGATRITKKHTYLNEVSYPSIIVDLYTEQGLIHAVSSKDIRTGHLTSDLVSVSTNRSMGEDCPTFTMNLVWRNDWFYSISSEDLVIISMGRNTRPDVVMIGLVDDIRRNVDMSSGQPRRVLQVTGRGLNKVLLTYSVGILENVSIDTGTGFFSDLMNLASCSSYKAIGIVLKDYVDRSIRLNFANRKKLGDYYHYDGNEHEGETLANTECYTTYNGNLWNFIKELSNIPFNETFWETDESGRAILTHRRTPFNREDWVDLPSVLIPDEDIVSDQTGRSDLETYTVYAVNPVLGNQVLTNIYSPLWYPPYVYKYGISELTAQTMYQTWGSSGNSGDSSGDPGNLTGTTINVPDGLGDVYTYMGWQLVTARGTAAYKLRTDSGQKFDSEGFGKVDGRYVIACTDTFGQVGDYIDFYLKTGTVLHCIKGDTKNTGDAGCNKWGHQNGHCIVEFVVDKGSWYPSHENPGTAKCHPEWKSNVVKAVNGGNYWKGKPTTDGGGSGSQGSTGGDSGSGGSGQGTGSSTQASGASDNTGQVFDPAGSIEAIKRFYLELFNWNIKNDVMSSGTMVVKGRPAYKVGTRVITQSEGMEYYVEGVAHNFNLFGGWTTTLSLTRGIDPAERFTPPFGSAEELSPTMMTALVEMTKGTKVDWTDSKFNISASGSSADGSKPATTGGNVEQQVYSYATSTMGLNKAAACAMLANINSESGFNLTSVGDGGTSYGLCQWHNQRWSNLKSWCQSNKKSVSSLEGQMGFLASELKSSYPGVWSTLTSAPNTAQGAYDAAYKWCTDFEVPADKYNKAKARGNLARNTYWPKY